MGTCSKLTRFVGTCGVFCVSVRVKSLPCRRTLRNRLKLMHPGCGARGRIVGFVLDSLRATCRLFSATGSFSNSPVLKKDVDG